MKRVLGTYELELIPKSELRLISSSCEKLGIEYLDTSICYNNDYLLSDYFSNLKIISKIPPQMCSQYEFMISHHLKCLGRDKIDIMLVHNARSKEWVNLVKKLLTDNRIKEVGVSNFSVSDLVNYVRIFNDYPKYNEIEINRYYCDTELVEFCKNNNIEIIAYATLGGKYNVVRNISDNTLSGALLPAVSNADLIILRPDNFNQLLLLYGSLNMINSSIYRKDLCNTLDRKSIEPLNYKLPGFIHYYDISGNLIPSYSKQMCSPIGPNMDISSTSYIASYQEDSYRDIEIHKIIHIFNHINEACDFEFITDYRVYFRYLFMDHLSSYEFSYLGDDILVCRSAMRPRCSIYFNILLVDKGRLTKIHSKDSKLTYFMIINKT